MKNIYIRNYRRYVTFSLNSIVSFLKSHLYEASCITNKIVNDFNSLYNKTKLLSGMSISNLCNEYFNYIQSYTVTPLGYDVKIVSVFTLTNILYLEVFL